MRVPSDRNYDFGGPGRGSGWRQRSLSNIDLTTQSKHSFTKQTRGYTSGLYDLYSRLETRKENENVYTNVNATGMIISEFIFSQYFPIMTGELLNANFKF